MTAMLASVTGPEEAQIALTAGADIIDLKDPNAGALGALPADTIHAAVRAISGRRPTSATVGDLPADPETLVSAAAVTAKTGVDFVKVGFFKESNLSPCIRALQSQTANGVKLVAVLFAELDPDLCILPDLARAGFSGVMFDTADKQQGGLRDHIEHHHLAKFVQQAKRLELLTGLAGSLQLEDIPTLVSLKPDYLGFRSALCRRGRRTNQIDLDAVQSVRWQMINSRNAIRRSEGMIDHPESSEVDW